MHKAYLLMQGEEKRKSRSKDCRTSVKRDTERSRSQLSNGKRRGRGGEVSSERSVNQSAERTRSPLSISSRGGDVGSGGEYSRSSRSGRLRSPRSEEETQINPMCCVVMPQHLYP